ncbi:MAG: putative dehydrogenase [Gammaproteobacteria bacterium]|jgi:putative dehydrogenase
MTDATIGVVGLGAMGMGTALALVDAGFKVFGFDLDAAKLSVLTAAGGIACASPAALAEHTDRVITLVVNAQQVEQVLFGDDGLAVAFRGGLLIQSATAAPAWVRELDSRLEACGIELLDSPISGGQVRAREGKLSVMLSGPAARRARAADIYAAVAANLFVMGDAIGQGSSMKLVNQLLAGVHIAVSAEAMAFAINSGLDADEVYRVITASAGNSWMFENRVPHILDNDYTPTSAVDIFIKDLGMVLDTGRESRFPLPMASEAFQLFTMASSSGHGREDDAAVVKVWEQLTDITLPTARGEPKK